MPTPKTITTNTPSKRDEKPVDFNAISLKLASPERILEWSYGEITKPETINYRTGRSERGGLFDERIFGPERDYECYCGKYKRIRYKDIVCEKCGVEVTRSIVRRERMGHIELASPVAHIWFLRSIPSRMGLLLDISIPELERVIYFAGYIITKVNEDEKIKVLREIDNEYKTKVKSMKEEADREKLKNALVEAKRQVESLMPWRVLDEVSYHRLSLKYGTVFEAGIGAETVYQIFRSINLEEMMGTLEGSLEKASSLERAKLQRRFNLVKSLFNAGVRPEWMFLKVIPVIPPALRPMVALEGGRHATSDVNDLYRRVINRNNRLKKLLELSAPSVILRNEKRILQEAVDALIDNSIRRGGAGEGVVNQAQRRPLKSLADSLRGKQGRFRQNLLGKRVDYSGRSVIVVGPELKLSQCGVPKHMALELFRPFVISRILQQELAYNIRGAGKLIDEGIPEVWAILEDVIRDKYVLLNRAPTLHRLGIQAFRPVLIEGNAIQVHPLVCQAFNADFDGDQMAVHVPLSEAAQKEAREIIAANTNLLKPGSGDPIVNMRMDIVLGCYWVTKIIPGLKGEGKIFESPNAAIMAYDFGEIDLRAQIKIMGGNPVKYGELSGVIFETSVGRVLFNNSLPEDTSFINKVVANKDLNRLLEKMLVTYSATDMPRILDRIKTFGFKFATKSGVTWGIDDVDVPDGKVEIVEETRKEVLNIEDKFNEGLLSEGERYRMTIEQWIAAKNRIEKLLLPSLDPNGSSRDLIDSGARGSINQLSQMTGMKGLMVNAAGRIIDFPIIPSYKEGLSPLEYFLTTHGSRKGLGDLALNTAKAGYLTRKLVDVSQDVVILEHDCADKDGKHITEEHILGFDNGISNSIRGRVLAKDLVDEKGQVVFKKGHLVTREDAAKAESLGIKDAHVRTPLTCKSVRGLCQLCYGEDPGRGTLVSIGEPVGIVAAQAIGEPGTQLTMRTKHSGGVSSGGDIVGGLPRVEEIFERRNPKNPAVISEVNGEVSDIKNDGRELSITLLVDIESRKKGSKDASVTYTAPAFRSALIKKGDKITKGELLTDGSAEIAVLYKLAGRAKAEDYIIKETNAIYELQGVSIARKHIEIIIRQMFSRRKIKNPGDTRFTTGEIIEHVELVEGNREVEAKNGEIATAEQVLLGITESALSTSSFLSAVSFQHAVRVLIDTAVKGGLDKLRGLKENVIIGRLIPAGTGMKPEITSDGATDLETGNA
jgi:DNA-directed RNA polymerase subunit beta'